MVYATEACEIMKLITTLILSLFRSVTVDGVWIGYWFLWHNSELQVITAPPMSSTFYSSLQYPLSIFQLSVSSTAVPWQRLLTVEIFHLAALRSSCHSCQCRTLVNSLNWQLPTINSTIAPSLLSLTCRAQLSTANPQLSIILLQSQSNSYFTTGSLPPISSSWHQAPWDSRPETSFNWTLAVIIPM
jgi:hypothetical protein